MSARSDQPLRCWRCGQALAGLSLPLSRFDACPSCAIELHVCRMCQSYDPRVADQCRNDDASYVKEKERPNFCDFFVPNAAAFDAAGQTAQAQAQRNIDALFGGADDTQDSATDSDALNALFGDDD